MASQPLHFVLQIEEDNTQVEIPFADGAKVTIWWGDGSMIYNSNVDKARNLEDYVYETPAPARKRERQLELRGEVDEVESASEKNKQQPLLQVPSKNKTSQLLSSSRPADLSRKNKEKDRTRRQLQTTTKTSAGAASRGLATHTYLKAGSYDVVIQGYVSGWVSATTTPMKKWKSSIRQILNLGDPTWQTPLLFPFLFQGTHSTLNHMLWL